MIQINAAEISRDIKKLSKKLRDLPPRLSEVAIKAVTKQYFKMIHEDIDAGKSFRPRTGNLQQSIIMRIHGKGIDTAGVISANKEYAAFVEFGTRPHLILPRRRKALKIPAESRGYVLTKKANHPGSKPHPYMFLNMKNRLSKGVRMTENLIERLL